MTEPTYWNWEGVPLEETGFYIDGDVKLLLTLGTMDQFFYLKDNCHVVVAGRFSKRRLSPINSKEEAEKLLDILLKKFKYKPKKVNL
jgi:hypothetical protein